jgi:polyhydroxybutyrate depolymerase
MKALTKILGFAVAALVVVVLGFYFIEVYAPSPANPTLSAAIQQDSIPIGSMTREFLEYVPRDISPHSPLVIVLHGSLMDAKLMRKWTGYEFDQLADQHGFVVVYPDGYKHAWNDCHSQATFAAHTENIDDMGFVKGLIAREVAQHQIDEKHVYVLGYSNGGQMALRLALQAPEQVAGIAIAGASLQAPEDSSCPEQGAVPLLVVQGEKDPIHPMNGGKVTLLWFSYRGRVLFSIRYRADVCEATRCDFCLSTDSPRPAEERRPHLSGRIPVAWRSFSGRRPLPDRGRWACGSSARVQIPAHPGPNYDCRRYAEADD